MDQSSSGGTLLKEGALFPRRNKARRRSFLLKLARGLIVSNHLLPGDAKVFKGSGCFRATRSRPLRVPPTELGGTEARKLLPVVRLLLGDA
jgi:hypothetical protein